jgi:hypothetical protein
MFRDRNLKFVDAIASDFRYRVLLALLQWFSHSSSSHSWNLLASIHVQLNPFVSHECNQRMRKSENAAHLKPWSGKDTHKQTRRQIDFDRRSALYPRDISDGHWRCWQSERSFVRAIWHALTDQPSRSTWCHPCELNTQSHRLFLFRARSRYQWK